MRTVSGLLALKSFSCQLERFIFIIQREHSTQPFSPLSIGKLIYTVYSIEEECTRIRGKVVITCLAVLNHFNNENESSNTVIEHNLSMVVTILNIVMACFASFLSIITSIMMTDLPLEETEHRRR
jgi:hypothetical protein